MIKPGALPSTQPSWHCLEVSFPQELPDEEAGYLLIEWGAEGVHLIAPGIHCAYIENKNRELDDFLERLSQSHCTVTKNSEVPPTDWVQQCRELMVRTRCGSWTIVPHVEMPSELPEKDPHTIHIIPGSGFGTGHHQSTQLALTLLEHPLIAHSHPQSILDIGTGSGILTIAALKQFPTAHVIPTDIDEKALQNARDNLTLNQLPHPTLIHGSFPHTGRSYDLIMANIYAEVLIDLIEDLVQRTHHASSLILSGILTSKSEDVCQCYKRNFIVEKIATQNEWTALFLRRRTLE